MRKLKFNLNTNNEIALLCPNVTEFYSKCYLTEDLVNNYRTLPGIKYATKIGTTSFDNLLKASTCDFTAGEQILTGITVTVCDLSAMAEICRFDIEQSFLSAQMAKGSSASYEVQPFMNFYWDEMAKEIQSEIEQIRWRGDTANAAYSGASAYLKLCDGYEKGLLEDPLVLDVTLTTVTVSNVISVLDAAYVRLATSAPQCITKTGELRFYVAANVYAAYARAVAAGNTLAYITEALGLSYLGIKIVVAEGMTASKVVLTMKDNMLFAFDGEGDGKDLKAINLEETVAEPKLRTRANLKISFPHVNGGEIVYVN